VAPRVVGAWAVVLVLAVGVRGWNALAGPLMWGYDAWGHVAYALFLDLHRGLPWADQGWSYFHPPLHYAIGWALAQLGDAEGLVRGLAIFGSVASLGTAGLAAWIVSRAQPQRPLLAPLAFGAVALLPVHLFMSPMPGNELTLTLLSAAALCVFIASQRRTSPSLGWDVGIGVLLGLAMLTKFSGLVPWLAIAGALTLDGLLDPTRLRRRALRLAVMTGVALLVCAPWYARNVRVFGTPFQLSRDFPLVASVERDQRPGVRHAADYLRFPLAVFDEPDPRSPALLDSVWGTAYANVWADVFRESDVARALAVPTSSGRMALLGVGPTLLFLFGVGLGVGDLRRGRRRSEYGVLLVMIAVNLAVFAVFTWRVPIWSALKSSYLLGLSLPFGAFTARGLGALAERGVAARALAGGWLGIMALAACALAAEGVMLPRRADAPAMGAVYYHFGEYPAARRLYGRLASGAAYPVPWLDNLAAVELAAGDVERARRYAARAVALERSSRPGHAYRRGQLALVLAVEGDRAEAVRLLDETLAGRSLPELHANRGALALADGDWDEAEASLRAALAINPELLTAWLHLARAHEARGQEEEAVRARREAERRACTTPRRYPHGLGTGEVLEWGIGRRGLLWLDGDTLRVAGTDFFRRACARIGRPTAEDA
jgi:Flp pilus assembly protein TadD